MMMMMNNNVPLECVCGVQLSPLLEINWLQRLTL